MRQSIAYLVLGAVLVGAAMKADIAGQEAYGYATQPYRCLKVHEVFRVKRDIGDYFGLPQEDAYRDHVYKQYVQIAFNCWDAAYYRIWLGKAFLAVGLASIVFQIAPPVFRMLVWLFIPDTVRRKLRQSLSPKSKEPPCDTAARS